MKIDFSLDDKNGIEIFTDIKDPFTFTARMIILLSLA